MTYLSDAQGLCDCARLTSESIHRPGCATIAAIQAQEDAAGIDPLLPRPAGHYTHPSRTAPCGCAAPVLVPSDHEPDCPMSPGFTPAGLDLDEPTGPLGKLLAVFLALEGVMSPEPYSVPVYCVRLDGAMGRDDERSVRLRVTGGGTTWQDADHRRVLDLARGHQLQVQVANAGYELTS